MTSLKLTEQQKKYLLYLEDYVEKNTISDFSKHFNCSRTNSKKILDRMLKAGLFYKVDNKYLLTEVGKSFSFKIREERGILKSFLAMSFNMDQEDSIRHSESILVSNEEFCDYVLEKSEKVKKIPLNRGVMKYKDLEKYLGRGNFPVSFVVFKNEAGEKNSNIGFSMANKGYDDGANMEIGEESFICLKPKALEKSHRGYLKKGVVQDLFYDLKGEEYKVSNHDSVLKIPLAVFTYWYNLGNGLLCSSSWMRSKVSIGFVNHSKKSNYLLILNLAEL